MQQLLCCDVVMTKPNPLFSCIYLPMQISKRPPALLIDDSLKKFVLVSIDEEEE